MTIREVLVTTTLGAAFLGAACAGGARDDEESRRSVVEAEAQEHEDERDEDDEPAVRPTGTVIEVKMITDDRGNYYEPKDIEAKRGDVIRFVLVTGVHNVHFLAEKNPGKKGLPPASDLLQLPGQTYELLVSFEPGAYYFQCDPHAALGMTGNLVVSP